MQSWHIAVLVVIVFVFFVILAVYAAIYWRLTSVFEGRTVSKTVVHLVDHHGVARAVDCASVNDPGQLLNLLGSRMALAYPREEPLDPSVLSLGRFDPFSRTYVEIDLDAFLSVDQRALCFEQSAAYPLKLLQRDNPSGMIKEDAGFGGGFTEIIADGGTTVVNVTATPPVSARRAELVSHSILVAGDSAGRGQRIQPPQILPDKTLLYPDEPVSVVVPQFFFSDTLEALPLALTGLLESRKRGIKQLLSTSVRGARYTAIVDKDGSIMVRVNELAPRYVIQHARVSTRYCIGNDPWQAYTKPFSLPPGRWTVKAEAVSLEQDVQVKSTARVYTVMDSTSEPIAYSAVV